MIFLGIYLLAGALAFFWIVSRSGKEEESDILLPLYILAEPLGWLAWLVWPVALPLYRVELRERARLRVQEAKKTKPVEPRCLNLVGMQATTVTRMCPTGVIDVAGGHHEARSEDGFIDLGERVVIVAERNSRLVVRRVPNQAQVSDCA